MIVEVENLSKSYLSEDVETRALRRITFGIERGEYVAIEGPSGCGKSTLLAILGLLDSPSGGRYRLNGRAVEDLRPGDRATIRNREIGFIFQNFNLVGDLTVAENVEMPLVYRGVSKGQRRARVMEVLDRVGLAHRAHHAPMRLSGGEQQRAAVARALAGEPSLLLADEPTGNLDTRNGEAVMELLAELNAAGSTIVMVTHDRRFARQARRVIGLLDGELVGPDRAAAAL
jgi:putative ABC transport system ATP-binding protein